MYLPKDLQQNNLEVSFGIHLISAIKYDPIPENIFKREIIDFWIKVALKYKGNLKNSRGRGVQSITLKQVSIEREVISGKMSRVDK